MLITYAQSLFDLLCKSFRVLIIMALVRSSSSGLELLNPRVRKLKKLELKRLVQYILFIKGLACEWCTCMCKCLPLEWIIKVGFGREDFESVKDECTCWWMQFLEVPKWMKMPLMSDYDGSKEGEVRMKMVCTYSTLKLSSLWALHWSMETLSTTLNLSLK